MERGRFPGPVYLPRMVRKTITIDTEAYDALRRHRGPGESYSDVIKRHFLGRGTGKDLAGIVAGLDMSEHTLDQVDRLVAARSRDEARLAG